MKKSILIIATVVLSIFNVNATNLKEKENKTTISGKFAMEHIIKVYDWELEIENGKFSGTALSKEEAQKMLSILSQGEIVKHKKVTSYYVMQNESKSGNVRDFYWEVKSKSGYAKGFASSEDNAKLMIQLVTTGEVITSKIIKSKK